MADGRTYGEIRSTPSDRRCQPTELKDARCIDNYSRYLRRQRRRRVDRRVGGYPDDEDHSLEIVYTDTAAAIQPPNARLPIKC